LGITKLFKQELPKQAVFTIIGLIILESNSKSEACEVQFDHSLHTPQNLLFGSFVSNFL